MTPPITAFVGGSVGSDPYGPNTWSGVAPQLFRTMSAAGLLAQAVGAELPRVRKSVLLAKNFNRNRAAWRKDFYLDPAYRKALTEAAGKIPVQSALCLQIGHMFCLPDVFPSKPCISYNDGNLPESLKSGFGFKGVSARRIDQALRYEEETCHKLAAILTYSEYLRQSFIHDYHVPPDRVFNIGAGVNLASIPAAQVAKDYSAPRLFFLGADFKRKGGAELLEAFAAVRAAIPTAELHVAGPPKPGVAPAGVVFHGFLSKKDPAQAAQLESLFLQSSLFVLPSLYEPFGVAPVEAMLFQLPCVVTDAWALRETVQPGVNGELVAKGSVSDLADKLIQLLSDPARLARMGDTAREIALRQYTWEHVVERMAKVIEVVAPV